ncbi:hypothetical protein CLG96_08200 [Sphingomonas oleivorans]|uniref:Uncharacterized protein n=1 Tax=Sphingomonas oleivorans TaxID=1735121 RepID=A0A2T5FY34_9SPHN|nr:hypothetical protein [Sphingomonas oleivorans]PTQ11422.1 hypothetical protein CLG96_08200 [Sphingomonas oleivorans]
MAAGLAAIAALGWTVDAQDHARSAADAAMDARMMRIEAEERQRTLSSSTLRQGARSEAEKARDWALMERTFAIAQMRAQSELGAMARLAGIANLRVLLDPPALADRDSQTLMVVVEGDFDRTSFLALLDEIGAADLYIEPVAMELSETASLPRFSLAVRIPYLPSGNAP